MEIKPLNISGNDGNRWFWQCNSCGKRNGNDTETCSCSVRITCAQAGGHHDFDGDGYCDRGCGRKML